MTPSPTLPRPPEPELPSWLQTLRFGREPLALIESCIERLGDVFTLRLLGLGSWVFVCSPGAVKELFTAPPSALQAGEIHQRMLANLFGRDSIFNLDGVEHRQRQRLVMPLFNGPNTGRFVDTIRDVSEAMARSWAPGERFRLLDATHRLSLTVLLRAMFDGSEREAEMIEAFERLSYRGARSTIIRIPALQKDLGPWSPWGKIQRWRRQARQLFTEEINSALQRPEPPWLLAELAQSTDKAEGLSGESLVDEVMTLLFTGHETTGTVLAWVFECLLTAPRALAKVHEELDEILGEAPLCEADVPRLKYLDAVIQETIRIRPLGPFSVFREVVEPIQVGGYEIPRGFFIAHSFSVMSRRADLFDDPLEFRPERFLGAPQQPYHWNPFGGGGRVCVGRGLAQSELTVAVASILRLVRLDLIDAINPPVRAGHLLVPAKGLPAVAAAIH